MSGRQNPAFGPVTGITRKHMMQVPKRVRRWLMSGQRLFWPIRCPHCRMHTRQVLSNVSPQGGIIRRCLGCGTSFTRAMSRKAA
jgi:hypothetical protein